jgi:antitoxin HicB
MPSPFAFPARFEPDDQGRPLVSFRDFPGALTDGADIDEARAEAVDLLESLLGEHVARGEDIPSPSPPGSGETLIAPGATTAAQLTLWTALRAAGLSPADLAARLGRKPDHVAALIDLRGYPALSDLDAALAELGLRLEITASAAE